MIMDKLYSMIECLSRLSASGVIVAYEGDTVDTCRELELARKEVGNQLAAYGFDSASVITQKQRIVGKLFSAVEEKIMISDEKGRIFILRQLVRKNNLLNGEASIFFSGRKDADEEERGFEKVVENADGSLVWFFGIDRGAYEQLGEDRFRAVFGAEQILLAMAEKIIEFCEDLEIDENRIFYKGVPRWIRGMRKILGLSVKNRPTPEKRKRNRSKLRWKKVSPHNRRLSNNVRPGIRLSCRQRRRSWRRHLLLRGLTT
jgi:hypothetical protein